MSADEPQAGDFVPEEDGAVEALRRFPEQEDGGLMCDQAGQDKDGRWIGCGGCVVSALIICAALVVVGDDRDVGVRAADARGDAGQARLTAETVDQQLVGEAVHAVDDQIGPGEAFPEVGFGHEFGNAGDPGFRVDVPQVRFNHAGLGLAEGRVERAELAVLVGRLEGVAVDGGQGADAHADERRRDMAADASDAAYDDVRGVEPGHSLIGEVALLDHAGFLVR